MIELPNKSTVLDFAFRVHSDVGLRFKNAMVNSVIKPIGHKLKSGDVVSVNTFKNKYSATKYWFDYLRMPSAKAKLTRYLRQQEKDIYIEQGKKLLNKKLEKHGLPLLNSDQDRIQKVYNERFEHLLMQIASKAISSLSILKEIYKITNEKSKPKEIKKTIS